MKYQTNPSRIPSDDVTGFSIGVRLAASASLISFLVAPLAAQATQPVFDLPTGLAPGTHYRLMFVTSDGITGTSSDISTYNSFVNVEAALNPLLPSTTWYALASTSTVAAANNIACAGLCASAPIYDVLSNLIAPNTAALLTGGAAALNYDETGAATTSNTWTGSDVTGQSVSGLSMGDLGPLQGNPSQGGGNLWVVNYGWDATASFPVTAISGDLVVPADVPEPASAALLAAGVAALSLARRRRMARAA